MKILVNFFAHSMEEKKSRQLALFMEILRVRHDDN